MGRIGDSKLRGAGEQQPGAGKDKSGPPEWRGFVNIDLSPAIKEQAEDWLHTGEPWEILETAVGSGCVVSVKGDPKSTGALASCTQRSAGSINAGYCLTARGGTAGIAWGRLMYILHVVGVVADWAAEGTVSDPDRW